MTRKEGRQKFSTRLKIGKAGLFCTKIGAGTK